MKNILFDFDGTVFDTVEGISKSVLYAIRKQGLDAPLESLRCFAGPPLLESFPEKFGLDDGETERAIVDFKERYLTVGIHESRVFPGIKELLAGLRADGYKLGIATSKMQELAKQLLEGEGMLDMFDVISGGLAEGVDGEKWRVLKRAMATLGSSEDDTVLVGDTKYDVAGAHRCGVKCVGVRYGYAAEGELEAAGADYIAEDIPALAKLLREI